MSIGQPQNSQTPHQTKKKYNHSEHSSQLQPMNRLVEFLDMSFLSICIGALSLMRHWSNCCRIHESLTQQALSARALSMHAVFDTGMSWRSCWASN